MDVLLFDLIPASYRYDDAGHNALTRTELILFCKAAGVPLSHILQLKQPVVGIELDEEYG